MFDVQAWWARDVMMGRIKLPSEEELKAISICGVPARKRWRMPSR